MNLARLHLEINAVIGENAGELSNNAFHLYRKGWFLHILGPIGNKLLTRSTYTGEARM